MADEWAVSDIVTKFVLNTCRLRPELSREFVQAVGWCALIAAERPNIDVEVDNIPFMTGSVAEFYIEPMLPHIGDVDVMYHRSYMLAIPRGHPPPTQLPAEFHNYVKVLEIIDSHLPGYVYLELRYLLTEYIDNGTYSCHEYDRGVYLENDHGVDETKIHGPAVLAVFSPSLSMLSVDFVRCTRCLSWPSQAADWPTRHRNYDWPDSATVDNVVNNGCDMVRVAHRQCRKDEWMSKRQHRLSFSRAEIVLINSWMPVQQIAYHMLRVLMKTELLKDSDFNEALSNYHIKTLMMWVCELKSSTFWTNDLNLIRICAELLHTLSVWLTDARCPHYFINDCNLIDISDVELIARQLMSIDKSWLSTWFVNNYIRKCSMVCPDNVSSLFSDVSTSTKLQNAVSAVVNCRLNTALLETWRRLHAAELHIPDSVYKHPLTARSCVCWMTELAKTDTYLPICFIAVAFLHVASRISNTGLSEELTDVIATITGQFISTRRHPSQCSSELSLSKATKLMTVVTNRSRSTMQMLDIELSLATDLNTSKLVELLHQSAVEHLTTYRQLEVRDFGSEVTIVTTDFEALYAYKHGDYQRCLQLSTQNVHTLLNAYRITNVSTSPNFTELLDDDIVSLTALTLIANPKCRTTPNRSSNVLITQVTLSLYLMTQCQLKLRQSATSLAKTLDYIEVAQRRHQDKWTLDKLTLRLTKRKVLMNSVSYFV